jgi:hypothetical protein
MTVPIPSHGPVYRVRSLACPAAAFIVLAMLGGCRSGSPPETSMSPAERLPIEQVLAAHTPELMAIPGVVGTAQGLLDSGAPCIQVLVVERTRELENRIPRFLEGWPVVMVVTGEIRAMPDSH